MRHDLLYGLQILCIVDEFARVLVNDSDHVVGNARHQKPHFFAPIRFIIQYRRHKVAVKLCQLLGVCNEKRKNLESVAHHIRYVTLNYHTQRRDKQGLHCIEGRGPFQMPQSECRSLKKNVQIVRASGSLIQGSRIDERRQNLPQNVSKLQDLTLCQLNCAVE